MTGVRACRDLERGAVRRPVLAAMALGAVLAGFATVAAAQPLAMVTDLWGEVVAAAGGERHALAILDTLEEADEVHLAAGARLVLVYLGAGTEHAFGGPAQLRIGAGGPEVASGAAGASRSLALASETGLVQAQGGGLGQAAIVMRGARAAQAIVLLSPRGPVLSARPAFLWQAPAPAPGSKFRFRLTEENGQILVEQAVTGERFELPSDMRLEEDRYYTWEVATTQADGSEILGEGDVGQLPAADRERIEALRPGPGASVSEGVLWALLLEREGLLDDARAEWARLERERPRDSGIAERASASP